MPSDGKSSHCLWQGELKREVGKHTNKLCNGTLSLDFPVELN